MKIARYVRLQASPGTSAEWGVVDTADGTIQPLAGTLEALAPVLLADLSRPPFAADAIPLDGVRLLAPVAPSTKVLGTGTNYMAHLIKLGVTERPKSTVAYFKPFTAIVGPDEEIAYPALTQQLDYEVELVAVIGSEVVDVKHGTKQVLGYTVGNDVSARDAKSAIGGPDLFGMKANNRSSPVGPWITTVDELAVDGQPDLQISLRVNGEERQRDHTSEMIFSVDELIEFVSRRVMFSPGDILFTGTTSGVGMEDGRFLEPGDVVEAEIEGIGVLRNRVGPRPG